MQTEQLSHLGKSNINKPHKVFNKDFLNVKATNRISNGLKENLRSFPKEQLKPSALSLKESGKKLSEKEVFRIKLTAWFMALLIDWGIDTITEIHLIKNYDSL